MADWHHEFHAWGQFYVIVGGGAAALTGQSALGVARPDGRSAMLSPGAS